MDRINSYFQRIAFQSNLVLIGFYQSMSMISAILRTAEIIPQLKKYYSFVERCYFLGVLKFSQVSYLSQMICGTLLKIYFNFVSWS